MITKLRLRAFGAIKLNGVVQDFKSLLSLRPSPSLSINTHCQLRRLTQLPAAPPWRVLFLGTDNFSLPHLKALNEARKEDKHFIESIEVVVPCGKCPVETYAKSEGLTLHHWPLPTMNDRFHVGVIVSFGHLIPSRIIKMFPSGMLNVHPSLLPEWRGASPILHTILNGDTKTAISIIKIRPKKFDIGPLLMQKPFPVPPHSTAASLVHYLSEKGAQMLIKCLETLHDIEPVEQKQEDLPYAHKFSLTHANINWRDQCPDDIDRQFRALTELFSLRSYYLGHHVKLLDKVSPLEMQEDEIQKRLRAFSNDLPFGTPVFLWKSKLICIKCRNGWVGFRGIVIKKRMTALEFYNGYLSKHEHKDAVFESKDNELARYTRGDSQSSKLGSVV